MKIRVLKETVAKIRVLKETVEAPASRVANESVASAVLPIAQCGVAKYVMLPSFSLA
jgi:hypothetical protein